MASKWSWRSAPAPSAVAPKTVEKAAPPPAPPAPPPPDPAQLLHDAAAEGRLLTVSALVRFPLRLVCTYSDAPQLSSGVAVDAPAPDLPPPGDSHPHGETALHCAACWGQEEVVRLLLSRGANVNAANSDGMRALAFASSEGHDECVAALLAAPGCDLAAADASGKTALIWASENGRTEVVRRLLAAGADVTAADSDGWTAAHWANMYGNEDVLTLLLQHGARGDAKTADGLTLLAQAKLDGNVKAVVEVGRYNAVQSFRLKGDALRPPAAAAPAEAASGGAAAAKPASGCKCSVM